MKWQKSALDKVNLVPPAFRLLSQIHAGTPVRIKRLEASPEVNQRLREMGFKKLEVYYTKVLMLVSF